MSWPRWCWHYTWSCSAGHESDQIATRTSIACYILADLACRCKLTCCQDKGRRTAAGWHSHSGTAVWQAPHQHWQQIASLIASYFIIISVGDFPAGAVLYQQIHQLSHVQVRTHVFVRMRIHLALALARGPASGAIAYRKTMVEAWKGGSAAPHDPPLDPPLCWYLVWMYITF